KVTSFRESILLKDRRTIVDFEMGALGKEEPEVTAEEFYAHFKQLKKMEEQSLPTVNIAKLLDGLKMDTSEDIATRVSTFFGEVRWRLEEHRCLGLQDHKSTMKKLSQEIIKRLEPAKLRNAVEKSYDFEDMKPR